MQKIPFLIALLMLSVVTAQEKKETPSLVVNQFFDAFHSQDTLAMRQLVYNEITLKSISADKDGHNQLQAEFFTKFLKDIKSIPRDIPFEERLGKFKVKKDDGMANVWVPYEFYFKKEFSHCGVNNIQLMNTKEGWKIISITDTRRKENCVKIKS